jgi:hypothetical protein
LEPDRAQLEEIMRRTGLNDKEAVAYYHLREAESVFEELFAGSADNVFREVIPMIFVTPRFHELRGILAHHMLARERPQGWGAGERQ